MGSWKAADGGRINVYSEDTMAIRICRVDSDADFGNHAAANARLIAAAPEMLEALRDAERELQRARSQLEEIGQGWIPKRGTVGRMAVEAALAADAASSRARAVVAKAEGAE